MKTITLLSFILLLSYCFAANECLNTTVHCTACNQSNSLQCSQCENGYNFDANQNCTVTTVDSCLMINNQGLNCSTCFDDNVTCGTCWQGYVWHPSIRTCDQPSAVYCNSINAGCSNCTGDNQTNFRCISCSGTNYTLNATTGKCVLNNTCLNNQLQHCQTCSLYNNNLCATCKQGYTDNLNYQYCNISLTQCLVDKTLNCETCSSQFQYSKCQSCIQNFVFNKPNLTCEVPSLSSCGTYDPQCTNCTAVNSSAFQCYACKSSRKLNTTTKKCELFIESCLYDEFKIQSCLNCNQANFTACGACNQGDVLMNIGACQPSQTICSIKFPNCSVCNTETTEAYFKCAQCQPNYVLQSNGTCLLNQTSNVNTQACLNNSLLHCSSCLNTTQYLECDVCQGGYFKFPNTNVCNKTTIDSCLMITPSLNCQACSQNDNLKCNTCNVGFVYNVSAMTCLLPTATFCGSKNLGCSNCTAPNSTFFQCIQCQPNYILNSTGFCNPNTTNNNNTQLDTKACLNNTQLHCSSCLNTTNYTQCDVCQYGFSKFQNTNVCNVTNADTCLMMQPTQNCLNCNLNDNTKCQSCRTGFVYNSINMTCTLPSPLTCGAIYAGCTNCTGTNSSNFQCLSCKSSLLYNPSTFKCDLYNQSCIYDEFKLQMCATCNLNNFTQCGSCNSGYVLMNIGACQSAQQICRIKFPNCSLCNNETTEATFKCTECQVNYTLNTKGNCVLANTNTTACYVSNCQACSPTSVQMCAQCIVNATHEYLLNPQGQCNLKPTCEQNQFVNISGFQPVCQNCSLKCASCFGNPFNCTKCQLLAGFNPAPDCTCLKGYNLVGSECISCGLQEYFNLTAQKCSLCSSQLQNCEICNNLNNTFTCNRCSAGYIFNGTTCVASSITCSSGQFSFYNQSTQAAECKQCHPRCAECSGFGGNCTVCKQDLGRNMTDAPLCRCNIGKRELNTTYECVDTCSLKQYFDESNNTCLPCSNILPNCALCKDKLCSLCFYGYLLQNSQCVAYNSSINNPNEQADCTNKNSTWMPYSYENINNLTYGYCTPCPAGCKSCVNVAGRISCSTCQQGLIMNATNNVCQPAQDCGKGRFFNFTSLSCSQCMNNCDYCTQLVQGTYSQVVCKNCSYNYIPSFQMYGQCMLNCSLDSFYNSTSDKCFTCSSVETNCAKCKFYEKETSRQFYCYECLPGYYRNYTSQTCEQILTNCSLSQVYNINTKNCTDCVGCTSCKIRNQQDPNSYYCSNCTSGFTYDNITQKCKKVLQQACTGDQYMDPINKNCLPWNLQNCLNKSLSGTTPICKRCEDNFFIGSENKCLPYPTCNMSTSFYFKNGTQVSCLACSQFVKGCLECNQTEGFYKPFCYKCITGDAINGVCQTTENCTDRQFNQNFNSTFKKCVDCPKACIGCKLDNATSKVPTCSGCDSGFTLVSTNEGGKICVQSCAAGTFLNATSKVCQKCSDQYCRTCNSADGKCTECIIGTTLSSDGICQKVQTQTCPKFAIINNQGVCQCAQGFVMVKNATASFCQKESNLTCTKGKFLDSTTNTCAVCRSLDSTSALVEGLCQQCIDGQSCLACADGYYLKENQCLKCSQNCNVCKDDTVCNTCAPPFKLWNGQCNMLCPTGTLPLVESLYRLNPTLFQGSDKSKLVNQQFNVTNSAADTADSCNPIAINLAGLSVCKSQSANLPYTHSDDGNHLYQNQKFAMQCMPCKEKCQQCIPAQFYYPNTNKCDSACKYPFKPQVDEVNNVKSCVKPASISVNIEHQSLNPQKIASYNVQNLYKDLTVAAKVANGNPVSFKWSLVSIMSAGDIKTTTKQISEKQLPEGIKVDATSKFLSQAVLNASTLIIDSDNLVEKAIYKIAVNVTVGSSTYYSEYKFLVMPFVSDLLFNDLDISTDDWGTTIDTGVATVDEFCAFYNFESSQIVTKEKTWNFEISAYPDGIPQASRWSNFFQSLDFQATYCFKTPYISSDQSVIIKFIASARGVVYTGKKMVTVLKPKSFDIAQSDSYKQVAASNNASLEETAKLTSSLTSQLNEIQKKNPEETNGISYSQVCDPNAPKIEQCSGHGVCEKYTNQTYRCKCEADYVGHIKCAVSSKQMASFVAQTKLIIEKAAQAITSQEVSPAQAQQGVETVKQAINIGTVDQQQVQNMQNIINKCAKKIKDANSVQSILNILDQIDDILDTYDDQALANVTVNSRRQLTSSQLSSIDKQKQEKQQQNRNSVQSMTKGMVLNIDSDKSEIKMNSSKYDIQVNQIKNNPQSSGSTSIPGKTNVEVPNSALPTKGAVSVVNYNKKSVEANAKQSNVTLASGGIEVNIYDQQQSSTDDSVEVTEKKVSGLTNKIKVKVDFDSSVASKNRKCLYLDTTDGSFKEEGVTYDPDTQSCVTSHLTLFVGASMPDTTSTTTTTNNNNVDTNNNPNAKTVYGGLMLPYLMMVFITLVGFVLFA